MAAFQRRGRGLLWHGAAGDEWDSAACGGRVRRAVHAGGGPVHRDLRGRATSYGVPFPGAFALGEHDIPPGAADRIDRAAYLSAAIDHAITKGCATERDHLFAAAGSSDRS